MLFTDGLSAEFIKRQFPDMTKQKAKSVAKKIREEIGTEISRSTWMNNETKILSRNKLNLMKVLIGYPESYLSSNFSKHYDGLQIGPDYFENAINYFKFFTNKSTKTYREPLDKNQWILSPLNLDAYYFPEMNNLNVPAAKLLIPTFHANLPDALNYGSVGFIFGHEMSHGLSGTGLEYDGNGNHILWWPSEMIHEYLKKAKCFVDQFNNYNVSGTQTLSENIADTAGLVAAYRAYRKKMKKGRKGQSLPGLETLDSNKLFFISFSMTFCHTAKSQISASGETDTHSKRSVRVNGAVANVEGFNEAFKCNNVEKCTLWN